MKDSKCINGAVKTLSLM